jgi:hypothetical protein
MRRAYPVKEIEEEMTSDPPNARATICARCIIDRASVRSPALVRRRAEGANQERASL